MFKKHDVDSSGSISSYELREAVRQIGTYEQHYTEQQLCTHELFTKSRKKRSFAGFQIDTRLLTVLVLRYANCDNTISFDQFIGAAVKLKTMFDIYNERDPHKSGSATFAKKDVSFLSSWNIYQLD